MELSLALTFGVGAIAALMIIGKLNWITDLAAWKGGHLIRSLLGI